MRPPVAAPPLLLLAFLGGGPTVHNSSDAPITCASAQLFPGDDARLDYYCGWNWEEANRNCEFPCPSGLDDDCPPLPNGRERRCLAAAGCFSRHRKVYWTGVISLSFDREEHLGAATVVTVAAGSTVAAAAPDDGLMSEEEQGAFEKAFEEVLSEALKEQLQISEVAVEEQEYDKPCVAAAIGAGYNPSTTSLDMVVRVVGEYIPVGDNFFSDEQLGREVLALVASDPESIVEAVRTSSPFFEAAKGIAAIEEDAVVEAPSSSPSEPPSRGSEQTLEVRIDPRPTGSYGHVFSVRTPRGSPTVLLTAMSFVTLHEGILEYEVYSKVGTFEKFIGKNAFWQLVASGQTRGQGAKEYTPILNEDTVVENGGEKLEYLGFRPLHVPGDKGARSFYITITKRYKTDEDGTIPVLFSYPIGDDAEGTRRYEIVDSTPELEVWEGDAVLDYPWPSNRDGPFYRHPRGFIGAFDYDRHPCYPLLNFTGWPCPYIRPDQMRRPTGRPTGRPTSWPTAPLVTRRPTRDPTDAPTAELVVEAVQTDGQQTEIEPPVTEPDPTPSAPDNDVPPTLSVDEPGQSSSGANGSWKVVYRSCVVGFLLLAMC